MCFSLTKFGCFRLNDDDFLLSKLPFHEPQWLVDQVDKDYPFCPILSSSRCRCRDTQKRISRYLKQFRTLGIFFKGGYCDTIEGWSPIFLIVGGITILFLLVPFSLIFNPQHVLTPLNHMLGPLMALLVKLSHK